jgi:hypothetical protein
MRYFRLKVIPTAYPILISAWLICGKEGATAGRFYRNADTHQPIRAPLHYWEASFPSVVKNSYGQIQEWGDLYLHPGVDLFEEAGTEVYSVADGIVRAILTTGDEQYWRIAIESFDYPGEGYLYAHLDPGSFPFAVGDTVAAGEIIGALFPAYSFPPHCHFARIAPVGSEWNGQWWTLDNPLLDIVNMSDTLPPVLESALGGDLFAFRSAQGEYLDPGALYGAVDIIAKVVDYASGTDFYSRIVPYDLKFRLYEIGNPDSVIYERYSFALDMPLDTYFDTTYYSLVLNTLYSRDGTCFSTNNNQNRDFYFIVSHSNGDSTITSADSLEVFDTTLFPDGDYLLEVIVRDCALNETTGTMVIGLDNTSAVGEDECSVARRSVTIGTPHPNPFNGHTALRLQLRQAAVVRWDLFDLRGRKMQTAYEGHLPEGTSVIRWNASAISSGMYFYRLLVTGGEGTTVRTGKLVLIK